MWVLAHFEAEYLSLKINGVGAKFAHGERKEVINMAFSEDVKAQALRNAGYKCEKCHKTLSMVTAEAHHKTSVSAGGSDALSNCQILCHDCHVSTTTTYGKH